MLGVWKSHAVDRHPYSGVWMGTSDTAEVEARSMLAFSLLIGNHLMAAEHGARSRAEVLELAARWLLA